MKNIKVLRRGLRGVHDAAQIKYMKEMCIRVDQHDVVIGRATKSDCHSMKAEGEDLPLLHRAFSVFLFNQENKLLLQKRSRAKITFPGVWTNSCCSHPLDTPSERVEHDHAGVKAAAIRKLEHELGIPSEKVSPADLHFITRIHYKAVQEGGVWGEHEIDHVLFLKADVNVSFNENEIEAVKYVSQAEHTQMMLDLSPSELSPWFSLISKDFLLPWWDQLDDIVARGGIDDLKQRDMIHKL